MMLEGCDGEMSRRFSDGQARVETRVVVEMTLDVYALLGLGLVFRSLRVETGVVYCDHSNGGPADGRYRTTVRRAKRACSRGGPSCTVRSSSSSSDSSNSSSSSSVQRTASQPSAAILLAWRSVCRPETLGLHACRQISTAALGLRHSRVMHATLCVNIDPVPPYPQRLYGRTKELRNAPNRHHFSRLCLTGRTPAVCTTVPPCHAASLARRAADSRRRSKETLHAIRHCGVQTHFCSCPAFTATTANSCSGSCRVA